MNHGGHPLKNDATSLRNGFRSSSYLLIGWIHDRREQVVTERVEAYQPDRHREEVDENTWLQRYVNKNVTAARSVITVTSCTRSDSTSDQRPCLTHRTLSVSLPVFTTAKGSGRLQSQKWSSLLVAIRSS